MSRTKSAEALFATSMAFTNFSHAMMTLLMEQGENEQVQEVAKASAEIIGSLCLVFRAFEQNASQEERVIELAAPLREVFDRAFKSFSQEEYKTPRGEA